MFGFPTSNRRHFLKHLAGYAALALPNFQFIQRLRAAAPQLKKDGRSVIVLWMGGGPPTIDLWDLKYGQATAFDDKPTLTNVSGVEISPLLPKVAEQMDHLAIIRALATTEGDHNRGTTLMHTGRPPSPVVINPSLGAMVSYRFREQTKNLDLPSFVSVSGGGGGSGFLGMNYAPFMLQNPGQPPENLRPSIGTGLEGKDRIRRRQRLFYTVEDTFSMGLTPYLSPGKKGPASEAERHRIEAERKKVADASVAHGEVYHKAFNLVASGRGKVFEITPADGKLVQEYGQTGFGRGCLLARKLIEAGVTAVEVDLGGWDLHRDTQTALKRKLPEMDAGMGTLVRDLVDRGLWDKTVLIWMGEFGRTPRINQNAGRDHWPRCWSIVVGGGGIKGGQAYGATNKDGTDIQDKRCTIGDVFATIYQALGLDPKTDRDVRDNLGRPFPLTPEGSSPLKGLI
jgi:hypothetical protein